MKFRKKPVVIEAEQYKSGSRLFDFNPLPGVFDYAEDGTLRITTLEGVMTAQDGDWIIRGVRGEFYPCKPDIFEKTYETVEDA